MTTSFSFSPSFCITVLFLSITAHLVRADDDDEKLEPRWGAAVLLGFLPIGVLTFGLMLGRQIFEMTCLCLASERVNGIVIDKSTSTVYSKHGPRQVYQVKVGYESARTTNRNTTITRIRKTIYRGKEAWDSIRVGEPFPLTVVPRHPVIATPDGPCHNAVLIILFLFLEICVLVLLALLSYLWQFMSVGSKALAGIVSGISWVVFFTCMFKGLVKKIFGDAEVISVDVEPLRASVGDVRPADTTANPDPEAQAT